MESSHDNTNGCVVLVPTPNSNQEEEEMVGVTSATFNETDSQSQSTTCEAKMQLSKRQIKKLEKQKKWEDTKEIRKAKRKVKNKEVKAKAKARQGANYMSRKGKKCHTMKDSSCRVAVAVDMSFDHLMKEKDLAKCIKQVHRCYSINRTQKNPLQFFVTNFGGAAERMIGKHDGWENWDVNFTKKGFAELESYPKDKLVYLSSESENVLTELKPEFLYVIGGLVDHNFHKGLCHSIAVKQGISHAKLPISEFLDMKARKVLTIDHVFEILLRVSHNMSWENALLDVIAPRKMAKLKVPETDGEIQS